MNGLQLAALLLVIYTGVLLAFIVVCALVPRVRAWYVPHVRAFVLLGVMVTR
jgi:hypothetical protein